MFKFKNKTMATVEVAPVKAIDDYEELDVRSSCPLRRDHGLLTCFPARGTVSVHFPQARAQHQSAVQV